MIYFKNIAAQVPPSPMRPDFWDVGATYHLLTYLLAYLLLVNDFQLVFPPPYRRCAGWCKIDIHESFIQ